MNNYCLGVFLISVTLTNHLDLEQSRLEYLLQFPHQNGFLTFTLGILFILSIFHFLLYFQHRDKVYLYYSCYAFFIILSQIHHLEGGFLYEILLKYKWLAQYPTIATEIYFIFYALFAFEFLDLKTRLPIWNKYNMYVLSGISFYCLVVFFVYLITGDYDILTKGYFIFTIPMILYACVMYVPFFKVKNTLKYYVIIGSLVLLFTSVWSLLYYFDLQNKSMSTEPAYSILYIGFILENVLFSLGLGHKQKLILDERNISKNRLIKQLKENDELRKKIQEQLERDVKTLNEKAEIERLKNLEMAYDKELAELKVSSLRSQMNPHFIFNSLNSIKRYIIDNEKENAVYYLNKFSKLIRKILSSTEERVSTLEQEIETLKLYVNIENLRFNNTIDFHLEYDPNLNLSSIKIPSLITQPFIENAIWHGLSLKTKNRILKVVISKENNAQITISILDNGIGRVKSRALKEKKLHKRESVGIKLSKERLSHFSKNFSSEGSIQFKDLHENNLASGTQVDIIIPIA